MFEIGYQRHLHRGERLLWKGKPPTGFMWRPIELLQIPFSLVWCGFMLFWNYLVWSSPFNGVIDGFKVIGLIFLSIGLFTAFGRFFIDAHVRGRTTYLVTDQRILIVKGNGSKSKWFDIRQLPMLELKERKDGSGTILFKEAPWYLRGRNDLGAWAPGMSAEARFLQIDDARTVYDLIRTQAGD